MSHTIVIGGGPGGYVAAIRAAQNSQTVTLIEKEYLGGTCLNVGCIPTKALLAASDMLRNVRHASDFGIQIEGNISFDWDMMQTRKNTIVEKLRTGIAGLLKAYNVTVIQGTASFVDEHHVKVVSTEGEQTLTADHFILAVGSKASVPAFIPQSERVITSTELLSLPKLPQKLLILGGGVIGCEFASLMNELGVEVVLVEMLPAILPMLDKEISRVMTMSFKKAGIQVMTGTPLTDIVDTGSSIKGKVGDKEVEGDLLLVSIGRLPVNETLQLQNAKVEVNERGWIDVNAQCQTNIPHIYAIGDMTGKWQLAHAASAMGIVAANAIDGDENIFETHAIPSCIFTHPEIGSVGLTAEQAAEQGITTAIGKFPFAGIGKALAAGEPDGFCKIITDTATDKVIGVHIVGAHAADIISEGALAITQGLTAHELGETIHPHPTLGEIMMETAHAVHGKCIHQIPPRRR